MIFFNQGINYVAEHFYHCYLLFLAEQNAEKKSLISVFKPKHSGGTKRPKQNRPNTKKMLTLLQAGDEKAS